MPRQDVPYGGAICRLRERIAEIFDKLGEKLHTINGVPGDGNGNVKIVSGSSAVVISNDPTQNEIAVSLDTSQLPAASVSSVNGRTGAVALDAGDIPSNDGTVQSDIMGFQSDINGINIALNNEMNQRMNADAALQTNINAVSASIPDMSVTPDPYKGVERDAQGRAFAADPASGATDKTLVTTNWVSQTGDSSPNNIAHRSGAETWYGPKKLDNTVDAILCNSTTNDNGDGIANKYKVIMKIPLNVTYGPRNHFLIGVTTRQRARAFDLLSLYIATSSPQDLTMVLRGNTTENYTYVLSYDADYAYISILTQGSLSDSIQTMIIGSTLASYNRFPFCTVADIFENVPGTEIRRITP